MFVEDPIEFTQFGLAGLALYILYRVLSKIIKSQDGGRAVSQNEAETNRMMIFGVTMICFVALSFWLWDRMENAKSEIPQEDRAALPIPSRKDSLFNHKSNTQDSSDSIGTLTKSQIQIINDGNQPDAEKERRDKSDTALSTREHKAQQRPNQIEIDNTGSVKTRFSIYAHTLSQYSNFFTIKINGEEKNRTIDENGEKATLFVSPNDKVTIVFQDNTSKEFIYKNGKLTLQ